MGILIDTCIWIDVERRKITAAQVSKITGNEPVFISPITIAELTMGALLAKDPGLRASRQSAVQKLRSKPELVINSEVGEMFAQLSSELKKSGRGNEFRIHDVWLGAQAVTFNFPILTYNEKDFRDIPGVRLLLI